MCFFNRYLGFGVFLGIIPHLMDYLINDLFVLLFFYFMFLFAIDCYFSFFIASIELIDLSIIRLRSSYFH
jgi:hypothetical protein